MLAEEEMEEKDDDDHDNYGPPRQHIQMKTIINYVTMTTYITPRHIMDKLRRLLEIENYYKLIVFFRKNYDKIKFMSIIPGMKELIKVLQEKNPDNCLQILVDGLVESGFLVDTGWKEKPDPISALLLERRESIEVIERLMEAVKGGDVNNVEQLLSQYPIPHHIQHIRRRCCCLALERRDLSLAQFLYQYDRHIVDTEKARELFTAAIHSDFTEGVEYLLSQGLPLEVKGPEYETSWSALMVCVKCNSLNVTKYILSNHVRLKLHLNSYLKPLEEAKSIDMLRLLLTNETIRNNTKWDDSKPLCNQILLSSTQSDCICRIQILIDAGATVTETFIWPMSQAWFKIIGKSWFQVIDYLLDQLKDINSTDRYDLRNILHNIFSYSDMDMREYDVTDYDVKNNILDFVKKLVERGVNIHAKDSLVYASKAGYLDVVKYLIEKGADVNMVDKNGCTALMYACREGHKEVVEYLIQHGGADVNMVDNHGRTALYFYLSNIEMFLYNIKKHIVVFKLLVESGGDLSLPSNGVKLFQTILDKKVHELFLYVISLKPQIVDVTKTGDNILHLLAKVDYDFTMEHFSWLFDCSVDINHKNDKTDTPLMIAAVLLNEKYLEVFTRHPAVDLNKQNSNGHTALHCLILGFTELIQGQAEDIAQSYCKMFYPKFMRCVGILLDAGIDVNIQDNEGKTVLMMAARENDKQLVRKLLVAGAMVDKVDSSGRPALLYLDISDNVNDLTIFLLLLPSGGNHLIHLPCIHGNTFIQTVLQFPPSWLPCKVVSFVRWLVYRNCSLQHLRGENGHSAYNDVSLGEFSISERQDLRRLLYLSGAPKEEIIATVNFQAEDEAEDTTEILHSKNQEMFENFCLNVSLQSKCIRCVRQLLGTEIRAKLPGLEIPHVLKRLLLLEGVVCDKDDMILREFEEIENESDYLSYIVDKNREYYGYLNNKTQYIEGRYMYYR